MHMHNYYITIASLFWCTCGQQNFLTKLIYMYKICSYIESFNRERVKKNPTKYSCHTSLLHLHN